ncbi:MULTISPECIES: ATP-binding protein [Bradyrhizobium]|nr:MULTISPECIES: winged helix-turn-helix domain-containing protein [Bradyrhizobium]APO48855.1 transcriptional regulator [Bradyrhizobium diazoefficiens]MCD9293394.1 helix-turn-helix transcriptional regulator [Bradyrhizobium diazoefficiens]MCD9813173.1 helix-turn-helix transcriptional regulator [Bradyrhizobium diazoefficiens]MCD9831898.1 helix-turn-helix transcriptional regulator [Bradyrhizobium diazoefficiens]MCD9849982.1 helix-turn-helix transcriptional regulator [Bradyrhizobium diazoefficiens
MAPRWQSNNTQSSNTMAAAGRSAQDEAAREILVFGPFRLDPAQRRVERDGSPLQLSGRAFDILLALVRQAGNVVSKTELMATTWPGAAVEENSLRVHIAALRKALGDGNDGVRYLSTVSGQGYCFVAAVSRPEQRQPAPTNPTYVHNLPAHPRQMVGREQAIQDISERLRAQRFVTVVGPGGIGKTTVAISAGHALLAEFAGHVHFVGLGETGSAAPVPAIVASSLGLRARSNDPTNSLATFLRDMRMLLILDCCEHVIEAAAALAERLYQAAPELHILATSRELLRVEGEFTYRLPPLPSPPEKIVLTAANALAYPSVKLFVERATAGGGEFALTDANASDVGNLCRRLDGIPLAIELTAGHVGAYGARAMVQLLDQHLNLLWEGRRTALPRHRTLRATIEWSYNLLSDAERAILGRLSVFVGSMTLDAVRSIAAGSEDDDTILAIIDSLVAKSMLALNTGSQPTRYRLADSTRAYAQEKLAASGDSEAVARRHACYFLDLLEMIGDEANRDLSTVAEEFGNVRAALTWCFSDQGDRRAGVALAAASIPLFFKLSLLAECELWVTRAIEALDETNGGIRQGLVLHTALGAARMLTGQLDELGANHLRRALELTERIGDIPGQIRLIDQLHLLQLFVGKYDDAFGIAKRGEAIALANNDSNAVARMRVLLSISCQYLGKFVASRSYVEAALRHTGLDKDVLSGLTLEYPKRAQITLARVLWLQGYPDQATGMVRRAISDVIAANHPVMFCRALPWAFGVFFWNGDLEDCEEHIDRFVVEARRHNLAILQLVGEAMKGITLLARNETGVGLAMLKGSIEKLQSLCFGAVAGFRMPLAEALAATGHGDEALDTIDQAIAQAQHCNFMMDMPDMLCTRAKALMRKSNPDLSQAELSLIRALDLARHQGALGYELRAAIALARLWQRGDRRREAHDMLAPVYQRFTEGFQTRSLVAARGLLAELNPPRSRSFAAK